MQNCFVFGCAGHVVKRLLLMLRVASCALAFWLLKVMSNSISGRVGKQAAGQPALLTQIQGEGKPVAVLNSLMGGNESPEREFSSTPNPPSPLQTTAPSQFSALDTHKTPRGSSSSKKHGQALLSKGYPTLLMASAEMSWK